ncbi:MAG: type II toxin-antitoxin system HigB family toxin [Planctomycetota bacterium]
MLGYEVQQIERLTLHFNRGKVYIRHVLTHQEYDSGSWKK